MIIGAGYKGSPDLLNSGAGNLEIVPHKESSNKAYSFYKFEFVADTSPVIVKINGETIYRHNGYFAMDAQDSPIHSFVVVTADVNFSWMGAHK